MDIQDLVPFVVQGSIILIVLAVGLRGSWHDLTYILNRPGQVLRGIIAVHVVVPTVAVVLCLIFPIAPATRAGIVIMAVSPLAPLALGKMLKSGADRAYVIGLYVALILVSVLLVPATVAILAVTLKRDFALPISAVASFMAFSILLPLAIGIFIATLWPRFAAAASSIVSTVGYGILMPVLGLAFFKSGMQMLALLGDGTLFVIAATILSGFAAGQVLGGPKPQYRLALAQAASTRHPGMAGLIAGLHFKDPDVMLTVLLFLFAGMLLSTIYVRWFARHYGDIAPTPG